jgi:hypothetical protein
VQFIVPCCATRLRLCSHLLLETLLIYRLTASILLALHRLPYVPKPRMAICILGDAKHCEVAQQNGIPCLSVEDLKKLNKNKKAVKKVRAC